MIRKSILAGAIAAVLMITLALFALSACSSGSTAAAGGSGKTSAISEEGSDGETATQDSNKKSEVKNEEAKNDMKMMINDTEVQVSWENNESVKALAEMTENGPVTIQMNAYGGFEQVGPIGATLPSNDTSIKTDAGDIMLYTSDHRVIFYGSNSWSYTKLGRITDKSASELKSLLSGSGVTVVIQ